jgi:hypothetical protein
VPGRHITTSRSSSGERSQAAAFGVAWLPTAPAAGGRASSVAAANAKLALVASPAQSVVARFLGRLATPRLFLVAVTLLGIDLIIPDVVPFLDEILLAILTLVFARRKPGPLSTSRTP